MLDCERSVSRTLFMDDVAVSASSNWDPASVSKQRPGFFEGSRVLSWKTVEELAVVRCDITVLLSGESVSSTSKWDSVWVSKQWPELFESGRVLSWETVTGLTIVEWDVASILRVGEDSHLNICEKPLGHASPASIAWAVGNCLGAIAEHTAIPDLRGIAPASTMVRCLSWESVIQPIEHAGTTGIVFSGRS